MIAATVRRYPRGPRIWFVAALLGIAFSVETARAFFPSLPPTNRISGNTGQTGPTNRTGPTPPMPPSPPPPVTPPPNTPPGPPGPPGTPPPPPFGTPPETVPPEVPTAIPEIDPRGLAAGLGLLVCGTLLFTDRKRRGSATK